MLRAWSGLTLSVSRPRASTTNLCQCFTNAWFNYWGKTSCYHGFPFYDDTSVHCCAMRYHCVYLGIILVAAARKGSFSGCVILVLAQEHQRTVLLNFILKTPFCWIKQHKVEGEGSRCWLLMLGFCQPGVLLCYRSPQLPIEGSWKSL